MRTSRGFTLVELMAAIGLMVVLAAAIPAVFRREGSAGVALRSAQRELVAALRLAQRTARARQVAVRFSLPPESDRSGRRWSLERDERGQWLALREAGELPAGCRVVLADGAGLEIVFRPDGAVSSGAGRIVLAPSGQGTDPAAVRGLVLMADGRIEEDGP